MSFLGNFLWFVTCGLWQGIAWWFAGVLWSITIIGIPIGKQCFKLAKITFFPFGKNVTYGGSTGSLLLNIIWLIVSGLPLSLAALANGLLLCITVVGIPFGLQCFKFAKLALAPFGATIDEK